MALIGYGRVSTDKQNTEAQQRALDKAGCDRIYTDSDTSGTITDRPELNKALDHLRKGDTLVVWKLDRLSRSPSHISQIVNHLYDSGINFRSLEDGIEADANGSTMQRAVSEMMITIMAAFAKLERDTLSERTKAGLETARQHGRVGGRPEVTAENKLVRQAATRYESGETVPQIASSMGLGKSTVYKYLKIAREAEAANQA